MNIKNLEEYIANCRRQTYFNGGLSNCERENYEKAANFIFIIIQFKT